jgi:malate synthase
VTAAQLLDLPATPGSVTEAGLRTDVSVGFQYVSFWLGGRGAAAINSLMEDAATAEISRSQIWQWVHGSVQLAHGTTVTDQLVRTVIEEELAKIRETVGAEAYADGRWDQARSVFEQVALADDFVDFLTLPAYELID